jgi:oligopeptide transport system substrate-binding protein
MKKMYKILIWCLPLFIFATEIKQNKEQVLRLNFIDGAPKFLHPHMINDTNGFVLCKALLEGLTRISLSGKLELAIAKKITISECKTKYTIDLRSSFWSNKKKLTAYHFVNTWKAAIASNTKCARSTRFFIIKNAKKAFQGKLSIEDVGIYAPTKYQIVIHLEHPAPYFTKLLASPTFAPMFDSLEEKVTVFNGPFKLKSLQHGKEIKLVKNLLYWDAKNIKLKRVHIALIQDAMTAYKLFQKGKLDFIGSPFSDLPEDIMQKNKNLKEASTYAPYWINFNTKDPKLASKKIRKALSLVVNREHIANYILPNAKPTYTILPQGLSFLKIKKQQINFEEAGKLFNEGLKEINCTRENYSIDLSCASTFRHSKIADYLKHCWEETFQIKVNLRKSDWITFSSNLSSHQFSIGGSSRYPSYEDPIYFFEYFLLANGNFSNWENSRFKNLINLSNKTISEKKRKEYLKNAEEILMDEAPVISLYTHKHLYLCNPALKNFIPSKLVYCDFRYCYFEENR